MKLTPDARLQFRRLGLLNRLRAAALLTFVLLAAAPARALVVGPYTTDPATLHLYHLDEVAVPSPDAATGGTNLVGVLNGASLGNPSYADFGNAVNTLDGGQDVTAAGNKDALITPSTGTPTPGNISFPYCNSTNGAFTMEAIVWIGFDPTKNLGTTANGGNNRNSFCQIMTGESTVNANRIFQFRICPKGVAPGGAGNPTIAPQPLMTFENLRMVSANQPTIFASIPTNGPNAIVSNNWYHVAVTYNGVPNTSGNIKFYWTLLDPGQAYANQIPITSAQTTLNGPNPFGTTTTPFTIGNLARNVTTAGGNFLGMIDEVRLSSVERKPADMMFYSTNPVVIIPPANQAVALGESASLNVYSAGLPPLSYQWRHAGTNLAGATLDTLNLASTQLTNSGDYDVVITNSYGSTTSVVATVIVRAPLDLTWLGSAGALWNTSLVNWDTNADNSADVAYSERDNVSFTDAGVSVPSVLLTNSLSPRSVTVSSSGSYTLTTTNGAGLTGSSRIVKGGSGSVTIDTDNPFTGPTTINAGILQVGTGAGRGSLGNGPVTNNGALVLFRTGTIAFNNYLAGSGAITNNATNAVTITGTNLFSGPITLNAGVLTLANAQAKGSSTQYTLNAIPNAAGPTRLTVGGGLTFGLDTTISLLGAFISGDYRCTLSTSDSTNTFNCGFVLSGDGNIQFSSDGASGASLFRVTSPAINSPGFTGQLLLRGNGDGLITSQINIGGKLSKTDGGTWTISSTGNTWYSNDVAGGTLKMGANNVMPSVADVRFPQANAATLDLAGFNQQIGLLTGTPAASIGSSSTSSDCTLTVNPPGLSLFSGVIRDSLSGGTRKVGLTLAGGDLTLAGTNTYTGDTRILSGILELLVAGAISNSANIYLVDSTTLSAALRTDGTLTVNPAQTLKGDGAFNIQGNLVSAGNIRLKLQKSGATLTNDSVNVSGDVTYGGELRLDITASPVLTTSDSFKLFSASTYNGAFSDIIPGPGFGLAWDTSTFNTDGTLRITTSTTSTTPTNLTIVAAGNQLDLSWPASYIGWRLQSQTNSSNVGLTTNWFDVSGSTMTNHVIVTIGPGNGSVFYRMVYP